MNDLAQQLATKLAAANAEVDELKLILWAFALVQTCSLDNRPKLLQSDAWQDFVKRFQAHSRARLAPTVVHTQRWPASVHKALLRVSHERGTSLNNLVTELCLSACAAGFGPQPKESS